MASYCSKECQKLDYKNSHKLVCKRIRTGLELYGDPKDVALPAQPQQKFGFAEAFAGEDFELPEDYDLDDTPVWEYDDGPPGEARWKRYPPNIECSIESLFDMGAPKYMYRPGKPDYEGKYEPQISRRMPEGVATCFVWFSDMIEREVYTGAGRAVRRNGSSEPPEGGGEFQFPF